MDGEKFTVYGGQRGGGKIFCLEQIISVTRTQLKATEEDRDRWKSAALYYRDLYNKQKKEKNNMKQYIGTKIIQAEPALRIDDGEGNVRIELLSAVPITMPTDTVDMGYKVIYEDGYESWSPKNAFEAAYRSTDSMNFGLALEAAKIDAKISRKGWNGKGMYVFLADIAELNTDADLSEFDDQDVECGEVLVMRTAQRTLQVGWLASQADMLADDWYIVE